MGIHAGVASVFGLVTFVILPSRDDVFRVGFAAFELSLRFIIITHYFQRETDFELILGGFQQAVTEAQSI